jgi:hypothetical protein
VEDDVAQRICRGASAGAKRLEDGRFDVEIREVLPHGPLQRLSQTMIRWCHPYEPSSSRSEAWDRGRKAARIYAGEK